MILEFDETNLKEVSGLIKNLIKIKKNLLNQIDIRLVRDEKLERKMKKEVPVYNSIISLYESSTTKLFGDSIGGDYYVYFHCDPNEPLSAKTDAKSLFASSIGLYFKPFYVGKGVGNRCYDTSRNDSYAKRKQQILRTGKQIEIVKIKTSLSEDQALSFESKFIDIFGLIAYDSKNWLVNLDEGMHKEERRKKYKEKSLKILLYNKTITKSQWLEYKQYHSRKKQTNKNLNETL